MTARFKRNDAPFLGSKVFSRQDVNRALGLDEAMDSGLFLGKLWALFGPADAADDGFNYDLFDENTTLPFSAYSGPSGPSYSGTPKEAKALRPVVEAFEVLLATVEPVDCEIKYAADIEYGGGTRKMGCKNGKSFDRAVRQRRVSPKSARSYEDCVKLAESYSDGYGINAGWQACLDKVLPAPPENFKWRGDNYSWCVGFTLNDKNDAVFLFDEGPGLVEIPAGEIPFEGKLSASAHLWLDALERWKREAR